MKETVVLGLSGGVDSAVAAMVLARHYTVHGLYLDLTGTGAGLEDARQIAAHLEIPFHVSSIADALEEHVCKPFAQAYLEGKTPIPCAVCNPKVKFPALFDLADAIGANFVATGHYACIRYEQGAVQLFKGRPSNDQSYLLSRLPREMLSRILLPLGDYEKTQVREMAREAGISVAQKPDSMEICFIPDGDYAAWLDRRGAICPPGDFVDPSGARLGTHKGIHHYTLGQRRGLHLAMGRPVYVSAIDPVKHQVTVSDAEDLLAQTAYCTDLNWLAISSLEAPKSVEVKLRHTKISLPAVISTEGDLVRISLSEAARAPTPGQMAVFYDGETVVGSGFLIFRENQANRT